MADTETSIAKDVLEAIAKAAGGKAGGWVVGQLLDKIFGSPDQEIEKQLAQIIATQNEIVQQLSNLNMLVVWTELESEKFQAATMIQNSFLEFQQCATITDDQQRQTAIKSLADSVTDDRDGIALALTQIDDVVRGVSPTQSGPGLLQLCMTRAITQVNQNRNSIFLIDAYTACRDFLSALFHLQYQGAVLLYNCQVQQGATELAQTQLQLTQTRLKEQVKLMNNLTPKCMSFVADIKQNGGTLRTRLIPLGKPSEGIQSVNNGPAGYNVQVNPLGTDSSFYFTVTPTDDTCQRFYFVLVDDTSGDLLYADNTGAPGDSWYGLDWWSGVNRKSQGNWMLLPCSDLGSQIISLDGQKVWTFAAGFHHFFSKAPDRIELKDYTDTTNTHIDIESMNPPPMFP